MNWVAFGTWVIVLHCAALALWLGSLALNRLGRAAPSTVAAVAFFVSIATVVAQKNSPTNEPPRMAPLNGGTGRVELRKDIAPIGGVAVPLRTTGASAFAAALNKVDKINARGAWVDSFRLDFPDGFIFPFGTNHLSFVEVFSQGYVRPRRMTYEMLADIGERVAIVPGLSQLSVEYTPSNSVRIAWEEAAVNRSTNSLISAAIELFRNGNFLVETNGVATTTERVHPSDLDGDGLPDGLDPNPTVWDGDFFGPQGALPPGANTNAYCWVDLVVHDADAEVVFSGDGYSNLADPHFMARAEATNRVTILIGKGYDVTCDEAIECVGVSDEAVEVWNHNERSLHVRWSVMIEYIDGDEPHRGGPLLRSRGAALRGNGAPDGLSRRMRVVPDWLCGEFEWTTNQCCELSMSGFSLLWNCGGDCGCGGCEAHGDYVYEGYRLYAFGGLCGCVPPLDEPDPVQPGPGVSVSFSEKVLFYEDVFTNSLGIGVGPYCASNVVLSCSVYGGERGGALQLSLDDGGRLDMVDGDELPTGTVSIAPRETKSYSVVYESTRHSDAEDDITATATFTETLSGDEITAEDSMTVVMLTSVAEADWPDNYRRRHIGVGEKVLIGVKPVVQVNGSALRGTVEVSPECVTYTASKSGGADYVTVSAKGVVNNIAYHIVEPQYISARPITARIYAQAGESGGFFTEFRSCVCPTNVSFSNVQLIELPRVSTDAIGYYAQPGKANLLDHGDHGAGVWIDVSEYNTVSDKAGVEINDPPWLGGGSFTWPIPVAWRVMGDEGTTNLLCHTDQRFELDADGTARVKKFGYTSERKTNEVFNVIKNQQ